MDNAKLRSIESMEDYLESILILSKSHPVVRSVDIAEELGYKKSSVSVAMKKLRESGDIEVTKEGYIYLTKKGKETATTVYERHILISKWLISLGVDEEIALDDACRIEHVLSPESFDAIKNLVKTNQKDVYEDSKNELNKPAYRRD